MNPQCHPPFGLAQAQKEPLLAGALAALTRHHRAACPPYRRLTDVFGPMSKGSIPPRTQDIPFLPVGLFKTHRLKSVADDEVVRELNSSGTTGQSPSRIYLDKDTASMQRQALVAMMSEIVGPRRLPMLVVDSPQVLRPSSGALSARGAGVAGMMNFGLRPCFALGDDMSLDVVKVQQFAQQVAGAPCLIFGFTFIVWQHLVTALDALGVAALNLSGGILVHSGGWKKMQSARVDSARFKDGVRAALGVRRCHNFYGMVEQVGAVFLEGEDGLLRPPWFADVIIRRPHTLEVADVDEPGVVEVVSALPRSYPGHALLTEDWGVVRHVDCGAWGGRGFSILGRVPAAEPRGCGDLGV